MGTRVRSLHRKPHENSMARYSLNHCILQRSSSLISPTMTDPKNKKGFHIALEEETVSNSDFRFCFTQSTSSEKTKNIGFGGGSNRDTTNGERSNSRSDSFSGEKRNSLAKSVANRSKTSRSSSKSSFPSDRLKSGLTRKRTFN